MTAYGENAVSAHTLTPPIREGESTDPSSATSADAGSTGNGRAPPTARQAWAVEQRTGARALHGLVPELEQLLAATRAPVTARLPWLLTWIDHHPAWEPWTVTVRRDAGSKLVAAALLATRRHGPVVNVVLLGHGPSDRAHLPAMDADASRRLALAIARALRMLRRPWRLHLRQLPAADPTVLELARLVPRSRVVSGYGSPTVRFGDDRRLAAYTSRNFRSQANHKWNQLTRDGADPSLLATRDPAEIERYLPVLRRIAQGRDREIAGQSPFDDAGYHRFFDDLILRHARRGEVELVALLAHGDVAAYSVAFLDGGAYRQWNKHLNPDWADFRPGHVLDARLLARTLADPEMCELDWMAGTEAYKLRTATDVADACGLLAWSSPAMALPDAAAVLKDRARPLLERHPRAQRLRDRVRETEARARRWLG
jgi:CelD/BcsL family acetyltransferase involved in cellulose biosynthesis